MKSVLIIIALIVIALFLPFTQATLEPRSLEITSLAIKFDKTDAQFTVNYDIGKLPKLYIILLGSKSIAPKLKTVFSNFDYEIVSMDEDKAILHVKNISRYEKGYYLHDSVKFNEVINTLIVYMPDSNRPMEYYNTNSTPNKFYR